MTAKLFSIAKTIILALIFSFGLSFVYAWTAPTIAPPNGNVTAPINTGSTAQTKAGSLTTGDFTTKNPLTGTYSAGALNLGATDSPNYWHLGYRGALTTEKGNLSAWYYNGTGWISPLSLTPAGNVGIGTTAPTQKLDVAGNINTTGSLTAGGVIISPGTNIFGNGSTNSNYGSLSINGSKNGWSGINFMNSGTLMMGPLYSGFYNSADNNWRMYVTDGGAGSYGTVIASDMCTTGGKCLSAVGGGGLVKYGGSFLKNSKDGACWTPNQITGICSCPAGYTERWSSYSVEAGNSWYAYGVNCEAL